MYICKSYGELYAYFLDVCKHYVDDKIHTKMGLSKSGQEMYEELNRQLSDQWFETYEDIIESSKFFSRKEKLNLLPKDKIIKEKNLDGSIYLKIMLLLGESKDSELISYMLTVRNKLCHMPMVCLREEEKSQDDFELNLNFIKQNLEDLGIPSNLLEVCERNVFGWRLD